MALVSYRAYVNAPIDVLWTHLLEKVETPEKFIPAVTRSEILERLGPNSIDRLMYLDDGTGEKPTREIITSDITMHWQAKEDGHPAENAPWADIVKEAVLQTKDLGEAAQRA